MFGSLGKDKLFGGPGDDAMEGEEDTDEHFGGRGSDLIDAAANETFATDAPDLVDCGRDGDRAIVRSHDIVRANCEDVDVERTATAATSSGRGDDQEQLRQKELFLQRRGN
jgi:hypothetical protein